MADQDLLKRVDKVRQFNPFYTQKIGVLHAGLRSSPFSLTEVRVLYELAHREMPVASELGKDLGLDPGYLSRILRSFKEKGFIDSKPSDKDGRQSILWLTEKGKATFAPLNERARDEIGVLLNALNESEQIRLVKAMESIKELLSPDSKNKKPYLLRPHQPGDMGWVVYLHGMLYAQEYGWDDTFEALAGIVAKFTRRTGCDVRRLPRHGGRDRRARRLDPRLEEIAGKAHVNRPGPASLGRIERGPDVLAEPGRVAGHPRRLGHRARGSRLIHFLEGTPALLRERRMPAQEHHRTRP